MIPEELLNKYGVIPLEVRLEVFPNLTNNEELVYQEFLSRTDYIPRKIFEELIENLATATALNFISVCVEFLKDIRIEYKEVLTYRKIARAEIARLENEITNG